MLYLKSAVGARAQPSRGLSPPRAIRRVADFFSSYKLAQFEPWCRGHLAQTLHAPTFPGERNRIYVRVHVCLHVCLHVCVPEEKQKHRVSKHNHCPSSSCYKHYNYFSFLLSILFIMLQMLWIIFYGVMVRLYGILAHKRVEKSSFRSIIVTGRAYLV